MKGTVLIVEDQPNFREGLKFYIEQKSVNWRVVGEAGTGDEGLRKTVELQPDLILMDIHMPVMNGIELAERIHGLRLDAMFVMITGFRDFQYAQSALRFGALDFLLKPCSDEDIARILKHAAEKLDAKRKARRASGEHALRSMLLKYQMNEEIAAQLTKLFGNRDLWLIAVRDYFPKEKEYGIDDLYLLQFGVSNIVHELVSGADARSELLVLTEDQFVLSMPSGAAAGDWMEQATNAVREYLGIRIDCIPLGTSSDVPALLAAYAAYGERRAPSATLPPACETSNVEDIKNEIMSFIVSGDPRALTDYMADVCRRMALLRPSEGKMVAVNHALALNQVESVLGGGSPRQGNPAALPLQAVHRLRDACELQEWLQSTYRDFERWLEQWKQRENPNGNGIEQALNYIGQHYLSNLSLKQVAEHVHLNPSYFSTWFKKETGETFTNYVNKLKLQRAQVLLRNTDMKITEICLAVGFEDSTYFSSVFRKYFCMSPSEFRHRKRADPVGSSPNR